MKHIIFLPITFICLNSFSQTNSKAFAEKASNFCNHEEYNKAMLYASKSIEMDNTNILAYTVRGYSKFCLSYYEEAIYDGDQALILDSRCKLAYAFRGQSKAQLGRYKEAIEDFNNAIAIDNTYEWCYTKRGDVKSKLGLFVEAIKDYDKSIELNPKVNWSYAGRGEAKRNLGQYEDAIKDLNKAIAINPYSGSFYNRGLSKFYLSKYDEAIKDFDQAIILNPKYNWPYAFRGKSKEELHLYDDAVKDFDQAIILGNNDAWTYSNRGHAKFELGQYNDAIKDYDKAILLDPKYNWSNRGQAKFQLGMYSEAIKDYNQAILLYPQYYLPYFQIGKCYYYLNNTSKSNEYFNKFLGLNNDSIYSWFTQLYLGQKSIVVKEMESYVKENPNAINYYNLACMYAIVGKIDNSVNFLDSALSKGYGDYIQMQNDDDLVSIRNNIAYNNLLKKFKIVNNYPNIVNEDNFYHQKNVMNNTSVVSDVDINIPQNNLINNNKTFAVIIANENYQKEVKVQFALNDGKVFEEYCVKTLGIPNQNIHLVQNATFGNMVSEIKWISDVASAYNGQAKIIFYYAGHGMPNEADKSGYLLPVDGFSSDYETAIKLDDLYARLNSNPSQSVTVFLDACFSGSARDNGMLANARGVKIKPKSNLINGNLVVFSAATGDETAYPYNEKQHGLFTYFLLKKLQLTKGEADYKDLSDYIVENVKQQSIVVNQKSQTPQVNTSTDVKNSWQTMKLK